MAIDLQEGIGPITFRMEEAEIRQLGPIEERYYFYRRKAWGLTSVWPEDPFGRITAVFSDPPDDRPAYLVVSGYGSRYVLPNGLRLGSSLAEVEKANGRPFAFRGLAQDDAGEVLDWCGGRLAQELPGVTLFFRPLGDPADGTNEVQLEEVFDGLTTSDDPVWKSLHIEVGKIQIARPNPAPVLGPVYREAEEVVGEPAPPAVGEFLAGEGESRLYRLAGGAFAVLLELVPDDSLLDCRTPVSLLRTTGGSFELVERGELEFEWLPDRLTVFALQEGGPDKGLVLADNKSPLTVVVMAEEKPLRSYSYSLAWADDPFYRVVRNERGMLEVRQRWGLPGPEVRDGATDFTWDGEFFRFRDGSKSQ